MAVEPKGVIFFLFTAPCFSLLASRFLLPASCFLLPASRFSLLASCFSLPAPFSFAASIAVFIAASGCRFWLPFGSIKSLHGTDITD